MHFFGQRVRRGIQDHLEKRSSCPISCCVNMGMLGEIEGSRYHRLKLLR